jgi:hypothetical protein
MGTWTTYDKSMAKRSNMAAAVRSRPVASGF